MKYLLPILTIGVLFNPTTFSKDSEVMELILLGEYEILSENYDDAREYFLKALLQDSISISIYSSLGELSLIEENYLDGARYFDKAFSLDTTDIEMGLRAAELYTSLQQFNESEKIIKSLSRQYPMNINIQESLIRFYHFSQQWDKVIDSYCRIFTKDTTQQEYLQRAVDIGNSTDNEKKILEKLTFLNGEFPDNIFVLQLYIKISFNQQLYHETKEGLKKIINLNNEDVRYKIQLAEIYLLLGEPDNSQDLLENTYFKNHEDQNLLNLLTITYSEQEDFNKLVDISQKFIKVYPDITDGYENLAIAYLNLQKYQDVLDIASIGKIRFPNNITFPYFMGDTYLRMDDFQSAKREFLKALELSPENRVIRLSLMTVFEELSEYNSSDSLFKFLYLEDENDATSLNNYAYSICKRTSISDNALVYALELAKKALILEPNNSAFLDTIGWIHYKKKDYNLALGFIKQSISIDSTNSIIMEHLGDIYIKMNDFENGLLSYRKAKKLSPENDVIQNKINKYE